MKRNYDADELLNVINNTDLSNIDQKIVSSKTTEEIKKWSSIYDFVLQTKQRKIINQKGFIR